MAIIKEMMIIVIIINIIIIIFSFPHLSSDESFRELVSEVKLSSYPSHCDHDLQGGTARHRPRQRRRWAQPWQGAAEHPQLPGAHEGEPRHCSEPTRSEYEKTGAALFLTNYPIDMSLGTCQVQLQEDLDNKDLALDIDNTCFQLRNNSKNIALQVGKVL